MSNGFEKFRQEVERDLGKPVDRNILSAFYYFGKGLQLLKQSESRDRRMSEPQKLGEILPGVLRDIQKRCEQNPNNKAFKPAIGEHTERVLSAVGAFMSGKRPKQPKRRIKEKSLS